MRDGVNLNDNGKEKPTVHFDKLMKLPNLEVYLKLPSTYHIAKVRFKIHNLPKVAEGFESIIETEKIWEMNDR